MTICRAEYLWIDGAEPTPQIRSKTRILKLSQNPGLEEFPLWSFDGSSTNQASGDNSDVFMRPVSLFPDPIRGADSWLVLCETETPDGAPHPSNTRARAHAALDEAGEDTHAWIGFEQEYTLFEGNDPLGFPKDGYPAPQGPYYCAVGPQNVHGRDIAEDHMRLCMDARLNIYGINAEVMPGQWEFQIGYRGLDGDVEADPLNMSDHLWVARWLLHRISEDYDIRVSLGCKPVKGDWNGAGLHTNFSTAAMRGEGGVEIIQNAMEDLERRHMAHIAVYGDGLEYRLTGIHETSPIDEFTYGAADRGRSVRIPQPVMMKGCGYFEDRRPGANADPYEISQVLVETVCGVGAGKS